ncbi:hypothetical protein KDN34_05615 [Shewanella yunxiaonensis]|uniref:Tyr recombinase domain-containing protein n=1 Tax=Shewanella yunxiaonensis TaxID=2829809 RepID=A0ABX7YXM8_9GAMM|nr:hypothetical protein [Shewanella yunxiaonensis]QUN06921.1 hypothetical protein KDN34_05615 [Shewanella yunxiaonensis]
MSLSSNIQKSNRKRNSGGVFPHAAANAVTLAIFLAKLANLDKAYRGRCTLVALTLWLMGRWLEIKEANEIPDFQRIRGSENCQSNSFRTIYDRSRSSCEYAIPYQKQGKSIYLWQPIPQQLNKFFQLVISKCPYNEPLLNTEAKNKLFSIVKTAWKTPKSLQRHQRVTKRTFFQYFIHCIQRDNQLSATIKGQLLPIDKQTHRSASAYQQLDSDRIRSSTYKAFNDYISRVISAARKYDLHSRYSCFADDIKISLISNNIEEANYLKNHGRIAQYHTEIVGMPEPSEPILFGSQRLVDESETCDFFNRLHNYVKQQRPRECLPNKLDTKRHQDWLNYFNAATYRIALLTNLLTGLRPTHSDSFQWDYYTSDDIVFVKDKGRLRLIILCDYLQAEIRRYLKLKYQIQTKLSDIKINKNLWFCIDSKGAQYSLSNLLLREFIKEFWPGVVPYQFRHLFSQSAISTHSSARLAANDIDRVQGHSNFGEHLGADQMFPASFIRLKSYLNTLPKRFGLEEMPYD